MSRRGLWLERKSAWSPRPLRDAQGGVGSPSWDPRWLDLWQGPTTNTPRSNLVRPSEQTSKQERTSLQCLGSRAAGPYGGLAFSGNIVHPESDVTRCPTYCASSKPPLLFRGGGNMLHIGWQSEVSKLSVDYQVQNTASESCYGKWRCWPLSSSFPHNNLSCVCARTCVCVRGHPVSPLINGINNSVCLNQSDSQAHIMRRKTSRGVSCQSDALANCYRTYSSFPEYSRDVTPLSKNRTQYACIVNCIAKLSLCIERGRPCANSAALLPAAVVAARRSPPRA